MTCDEARDRLSAYADEALTPDERARVEAHLTSCADCRRELASLRQTVALLQRVERARAPVGFVDRVVAAARPRPWYRRIADAVLLPLPVKLPLGVTAALMVGLLAVFLFERTPELQQAARQEAPRSETPGAPVPAPGREQPAVARPTSAPPAPTLMDKSARSKPEAEAPGGAPAPPRAGGERDRRDAPASRDATPPASPPPAPAPPATAPAPTVPPPSEARSAPERKESPSASVGAAARQEVESRPRALERAAESGSPRLAAKRAAPSADVVTSVAVKDRDAAERDLAALIASVGGRVAQRRSEADATTVEAVIPQPRYAEFSEGLTRIGTWQVEAERPDLPAQIRVILRLQ